MSAEAIYCWISAILAIGLIQSYLESLILYVKYPSIHQFSLTNGILSSSLIKKFRFAFNSPGVWVLSVVRILLALLLLITALNGAVYFELGLGLLIIDVIAFPRWRFFPTSESAFQKVVLVTLCIHAFFEEQTISNLGLAFIAIQLCMAYFLAGLQKLRDKTWRNGESFRHYLIQSSILIGDNAKRLKGLSYLIIFFEMSFFLTLLGGNLLIVYASQGIIFHLFLSVRNGFNFFLWTFLSGYPAIHYVAENIDEIMAIAF